MMVLAHSHRSDVVPQGRSCPRRRRRATSAPAARYRSVLGNHEQALARIGRNRDTRICDITEAAQRVGHALARWPGDR